MRENFDMKFFEWFTWGLSLKLKVDRLTCMSLHMRIITNRLRKKPKNPIKKRTTAANVNPQSGISSWGVSSSNVFPFLSVTTLISVTDNVFIIMTNSIWKNFLCATAHSGTRTSKAWNEAWFIVLAFSVENSSNWYEF